MICQKCHHNLASIRYAEVIHGRVSHLMICSNCYEQMCQGSTTGFEIAGPAPAPKSLKRQTIGFNIDALGQACPACGYALRTLLETGRAGCANCYSAFGEALAPVISERHGALLHKGKAPKMSGGREQTRALLQSKRSILRSALEKEDYEEAARLRDEIRGLESLLNPHQSKEN